MNDQHHSRGIAGFARRNILSQFIYLKCNTKMYHIHVREYFFYISNAAIATEAATNPPTFATILPALLSFGAEIVGQPVNVSLCPVLAPLAAWHLPSEPGNKSGFFPHRGSEDFPATAQALSVNKLYLIFAPSQVTFV